MNSLSWFIYLADFFGNIRFILTLLLFVVAIPLAIVLIILTFMASEGDADKIANWPRLWKALTWLGAVLVIIAILRTPIPSKDTMYAIAASEMGETIIKNDEVKGVASDATKALRQWINKQIEPEKGK